ncbi:hypothetical protein D3C85_1512830 [compost metagenome]
MIMDINTRIAKNGARIIKQSEITVALGNRRTRTTSTRVYKVNRIAILCLRLNI